MLSGLPRGSAAVRHRVWEQGPPVSEGLKAQRVSGDFAAQFGLVLCVEAHTAIIRETCVVSCSRAGLS